MRYSLLKPLLGACLLMWSYSSVAQNYNPFAGNWVLDLSASNYTSGPAPQQQTRAYQVRGGGTFVFILDGMAADGSRVHFSASYKYDNLEYPLAGLNQAQAQTIAYSRVNNRSVAYNIREQGRVTQTGTKVVSDNGRTMTITVQITNLKGQHFTDVLVFRKH